MRSLLTPFLRKRSAHVGKAFGSMGSPMTRRFRAKIKRWSRFPVVQLLSICWVILSFICILKGLPGNTGPQGRQGPPGPVVSLFFSVIIIISYYFSPSQFVTTLFPLLLCHCRRSQGAPGAPGAPGPNGSAGSPGDQGLPVSELVSFLRLWLS